VPLEVTGSPDEPDLMFLPWATSLEEWPAESLVALPRGISRHVVRFVRLNGLVYAVKEVGYALAEHEYALLRRLDRLDVPCVEAVGVVTGRVSPDGTELDSALITKHLQFSLPYRALFSQTLRPDTANRLLDALALLLVRLHLSGFLWLDCSLSNTLFRRDAGAFAAYLVDAETGELYERLSDGQREHDLDVAHVNIYGELLDLEAGGLLHPTTDPMLTAEKVIHRYRGLWGELSEALVVSAGERFRVDDKVRRLNDLGFDVGELQIVAESDGSRVRVRPKVVDAGHHSRRLLRLTGLDVQENQARRLLNDLDAYRLHLRLPDDDEELVAHRWVAEVFEPVVRSVPRELRGKLEPAEVYHEVLEHRWFLSERAGEDIGTMAAAKSYVDQVLAHRPDEQAVLGKRLGTPSDTTQSIPPILD
jgi:Domain of unknown function (DUF4032)/Lipopolysaccharide kinase (Kdo/WaaP) family